MALSVVAEGDPLDVSQTRFRNSTLSLDPNPRPQPQIMATASTRQMMKLPREGAAPGGGRLQVLDRGYMDAMFGGLPGTPVKSRTPMAAPGEMSPGSPLGTSRRSSVFPLSKESTPSGTPSQHHRRDVRGGHSASPKHSAGGVGHSRSAPDLTAPSVSPQQRQRHRLLLARPDQEEKMYADLCSKWQRNEASRESDGKAIRERVARNSSRRDERFNRLLENLSRQDSQAHEIATMLHEQDELEYRKCKELHAEWEEKVHGPLMMQAHHHLNPPNRLAIQRQIGVKSVDFTLPEQQTRLLVRGREDPMKRVLIENATENAFRHAASHVILGHSNSAPSLMAGHPSTMPPPQDSSSFWGSPPPAMTKPMVDVSSYSCVPEHVPAPEYPSGVRRGPGVHIPSEHDGVASAGTRWSHTEGYNYKGILNGDNARGEAAKHRKTCGGGSSAPAQDHYNYPIGKESTDLEVPRGKKTFPLLSK